MKTEIKIDRASLEAAAEVTGGCSPAAVNRGYNVEIAYNPNTGEVFAEEFIGDHFTAWDDPSIINICYATDTVTADQLAEMIELVLKAGNLSNLRNSIADFDA